jgi:DNA polymerase
VPRLWRAADKLIQYMANGKSIRLGPIHTIKEAIVLPNGMRLNYPDLKQQDGQWTYLYRGKRTYLYGAKLIENIVQALARIIVSTAEVWLYRRGWLSSLQVHDELVYVVPGYLAEKFKLVLEKTLVRPVDWMEGLPVACEVAIGDNYAEAK